jgi:hypothetical protein
VRRVGLRGTHTSSPTKVPVGLCGRVGAVELAARTRTCCVGHVRVAACRRYRSILGLRMAVAEGVINAVRREMALNRRSVL